MQASETKVVLVDEWAGSGDIPLRVNGILWTIKQGEPRELPGEFIEALRASHVKFMGFPTMAAARAEIERRKEKNKEEAPAGEPVPNDNETDQQPADLSVLDGNLKDVTQALDGLSNDHLRELLAAEEGGKTRKSVVAAINKALEA